MLKKGDIILVVLIIIAIGIGFFSMQIMNSGNKHRIAEIVQNNKVIKRIDLDKVTKPERINVLGLYNEIILVEKGRIRFEEAQCPDLVCVKKGWLSKAGDSAACIPNRALIRIKGENNELDAVTF